MTTNYGHFGKVDDLESHDLGEDGQGEALTEGVR
jgi:hypothetical protein